MRTLLLTVLTLFTLSAQASDQHDFCLYLSNFAEVAANDRDAGVHEAQSLRTIYEGVPDAALREWLYIVVEAVYDYPRYSPRQEAIDTYNACMSS